MHIYFQPVGDEIKPFVCLDDRAGYMYIPETEFHNYIDMLRNELSVYAELFPNNPQLNRIRTGNEPIGEEET